MPGEKVRIGVLASGSGTNLEAILAAGLPVVVVVVDRPCRATDVAGEHGLPGVVVQRDSFGPAFDREAYTERVVDALESHDVDVVVMAGFGTILAKQIHDAYPGRILNTHPALLPAFPGWHAVEEALAAGVKVTGVTVHVATVEVDTGPILAQEAVPVLPGDTVESLHERIKVVERHLYPETIRTFVDDLERVGASTPGWSVDPAGAKRRRPSADHRSPASAATNVTAPVQPADLSDQEESQ